MKILSSFLLLALITLGGCSADDLTGPDSATDAFALSAQAPEGEAAHPDRSATQFTAAGTWEAADQLGTITLFINELPPAPSTARIGTRIGGKGIVHDLFRRPVDVTLEGRYTRFDIEFALLGSNDDTLAKGQGMFSTDRSAFKVELTFSNGSQRTLVFTR